MLKLKTILYVAILIVVIQSIYAISNVQHSVSGSSITLTYEGNPPFWINIRNDQNIGQNGGYVWAKTYSDSFTIDLGFANNPNNNLYYGVKDNFWSNTNSFSLGGNDIIDLIASDDPNDYLGEKINPQMTDSDWMNYQPIIDKVNSLIQGKNSDYEKANAIIDWMRLNKTYDYAGTLQGEGSVIDVFNSNSGVCWDSAVLAVGMLRLADIPARYTAPAASAHTFIQFYLDNHWVATDPTYPQEGINPDDLTFMTHNCSSSLSTRNFNQDSFSPKRNRIVSYMVDTIKSGTIIYPILSYYLISCNANECFLESEETAGEPILGISNSATLTNIMCGSYFTCRDCEEFCNLGNQGPDCLDWCNDNIGAYSSSPHIPSRLKVVGSETIESVHSYAKIKSPRGHYKIEYINGYMGDVIAYVEFDLSAYGEVKITPAMFVKNPDIDQRIFDEFMGLVNALE